MRACPRDGQAAAQRSLNGCGHVHDGHAFNWAGDFHTPAVGGSGQHARVGLGICMVIMDMQVYQLGQLYESFVDLSPASAETLTWPPGWLAQI